MLIGFQVVRMSARPPLSIPKMYITKQGSNVKKRTRDDEEEALESQDVWSVQNRKPIFAIKSQPKEDHLTISRTTSNTSQATSNSSQGGSASSQGGYANSQDNMSMLASQSILPHSDASDISRPNEASDDMFSDEDGTYLSVDPNLSLPSTAPKEHARPLLGKKTAEVEVVDVQGDIICICNAVIGSFTKRYQLNERTTLLAKHEWAAVIDALFKLLSTKWDEKNPQRPFTTDDLLEVRSYFMNFTWGL
jgi:hypothetical protein